MSINEAIRIVGERWRSVVVCLLVGLLGAAVAVMVIPKQYAADVPLYVSVVGQTDSSDDAYQANQLAKDKMSSYAALMADKRITQAVIDQLQLPMTTRQLAKHLTVTVEPESVVMTATVTDTSPQRAAAIAQTVAEEFVALVSQLEQPVGSTAPAPLPAATPPGVRQQPAPPPTPKQIKPRIVRPALASPVPVSPNVPFGLALGGALGLLIGTGAAFLGNARDRSVRDPARLQALIGASVLASIPSDPTARFCPIIAGKSPESPRAEAYRRLRTNLRFHRGAPEKRGARVVVVTSPGIGEGTTVTACNLARTLSAGSRVLLIDANLRDPRVSTYLSLDSEPGLTSVLTGAVRWPSATRKLSDVTLEVLPSGPVGALVGELLTWFRMDEMLDDLRRHYDFVIIDAPALLPVADAAAVAARADGVILVIRHGTTTEEQVTAAVHALRSVSTPLVGAVLNMTPRPRRSTTYAELPASRTASMFDSATLNALPLQPSVSGVLGSNGRGNDAPQKVQVDTGHAPPNRNGRENDADGSE